MILDLFNPLCVRGRAGQTNRVTRRNAAAVGDAKYERAPGDGMDFGVNLNNGGAGLMTVQAQLKFPIVPRLTGTLESAYFAASSISRVWSSWRHPLHGDRTGASADL